jgi:hypothetical protein
LVYSSGIGSQWKVLEEVHCIGENDSTRRVDILFFQEQTKEGYIFDPTVRFEVDDQQAEEVDREKKSIYEPCVPYFKEKYALETIEVHGLLIGARGTLTSYFTDFIRKFGLLGTVKKEIIIAAVRGSVKIAHHHCYNTTS